ncbi:hypothetical protein ACWDE9_36440, partial [Streptomyces olivaceoviridis]
MGEARRAGGDAGRTTVHTGLGTGLHPGVEHLQQPVEVAVPRGGQEGVHHLPLPGQAGLRRPHAPHPAPGTAGELPGRGRATAEDAADLLEGHPEQVVQ